MASKGNQECEGSQHQKGRGLGWTGWAANLLQPNQAGPKSLTASHVTQTLGQEGPHV